MLRTRRLVLIGVGLVAMGLSSCGKDGRKPTFPVSGQVLQGNKPVANATVILHPVEESGPDTVKPHGRTQADGTFTLTTYDGDDGAPAGDYRVTVELWLASPRGDEGPSNRLPARFAQPGSSGLSASVPAGATELQPFHLKR
jgi:hypothetical protein